MPDFISKLQYTDSEIGEFFDEQIRDLDSTIQLIQDFPWHYQRRYIDNSYTGPSITIQSEQNDYLKVSIHNGSEFWVLLFKNGRLYEYPIKNLFLLDEAIAQVTQFFNNLIAISEYKWLRFQFLVKRHFTSKLFIYRPSALRLIKSLFSYLILFAYSLFINFIFWSAPPQLSYSVWLLLPLIPTAILLRCIILVIKKFIQCRDSYIQISETRNEFIFCDNGEAKTYYKTNIKKIITHTAKYDRSPNASFGVYEIFFKDESFITFSTLLGANFTVADKFRDDIEDVNEPDFKLTML